MNRTGIALQLYSVREECAKDFVGTLRKISGMGYEGVEFAGYYEMTAESLRKNLDELGLSVAGSHVKLDSLLGDELEKTIEFNTALGNKFLIVPGLPKEYTSSKNAWIKTADLFNEISAKVKPYGMRIGYHNHYTEFNPIIEGEENPWDIFFGRANNDVVMQLDTGNCKKGGGNPVAILKRYPGRARTIHFKEFSSTDDKAILGEGEVDWKEILDLCEKANKTEWYIIEQESYAYPPIECVRLCLDNLKGA